MNKTSLITKTALIAISAYVGIQMLSDIASLKIGIVWGLAVDMGTFIYPITFTLRDIIHKTSGKQTSQIIIITCGIINLFMAGYLLLVAMVPGDPTWGLGAEFSSVLTPVWRIVIASILAEVISELVDTEVYHWFITKITTKYQWLRVLFSNSVSIPIDNAIFTLGAFALSLPWSVVWEIFLLNLIVKYCMTLVSLPMIYIAPDSKNA